MASQFKTRIVLTSHGRATVAVNDCPPGTILTVTAPCVSVDGTDVCATCFKQRKHTHAEVNCPICGVPWYCTRSCQTNDIFHPYVCHYQSSFSDGEPVLKYEHIMVRALGYLAQSPQRFASFMNLQSHRNTARNSTAQSLMARSVISLFGPELARISGYLEELTKERPRLAQVDATDVASRVLINCATFYNSKQEELGLFVDPTLSSINHSCDPNCIILFEGRFAKSQATKYISQNEELTIAYVCPTLPTPMRQFQSENQFYFTCDCSSCTQDSNAMFRMRCPMCGHLLKDTAVNEPVYLAILTKICDNCHVDVTEELFNDKLVYDTVFAVYFCSLVNEDDEPVFTDPFTYSEFVEDQNLMTYWLESHLEINKINSPALEDTITKLVETKTVPFTAFPIPNTLETLIKQTYDSKDFFAALRLKLMMFVLCIIPSTFSQLRPMSATHYLELAQMARTVNQELDDDEEERDAYDDEQFDLMKQAPAQFGIMAHKLACLFYSRDSEIIIELEQLLASIEFMAIMPFSEFMNRFMLRFLGSVHSYNPHQGLLQQNGRYWRVFEDINYGSF